MQRDRLIGVHHEEHEVHEGFLEGSSREDRLTDFFTMKEMEFMEDFLGIVRRGPADEFSP